MGPPGSSNEQPPGTPDPGTGDLRRLWTPWRMRYVGGGTRETGCLFCNRLLAEDDARALILHRGDRAFAIMNLFPYNTGHLMLVPTAHVASPEEADPAALAEIATLLPTVTRALRRALGCDGFNVGLNVGAVAGAGVADHLHQHVVPRWVGDANFMPILASTMVLPELVPVTYAKLRAELARESGGSAEVICVVLSPDHERVMTTRGPQGSALPRATVEPTEAVWRAAARVVGELAPSEAELVGWAGASRVEGEGSVALSFRLRDAPGNPGATRGRVGWVPIADANADLGAAARLVANAVANVAPSVAVP